LLELLLREPGLAELKLNLSKNLEGSLTLKELPLSYRGAYALLDGKVSFKKDEQLSARGRLTARKLGYRGLTLGTARAELFVEGPKLRAYLRAPGLYGEVRKETHLYGRFILSDFRLGYGPAELLVKRGFLSFRKEDGLTFSGKLESFRVTAPQARLEGSAELKGRPDELKASAEVDLFVREKPVEKDLKLTLLLTNGELKLKGASEKTRLRLLYALEKRVGNLKLTRKGKLSLKAEASLKQNEAHGRFTARYALDGKPATLKGRFFLKEDRLRLTVDPSYYEGAKLSYAFKGLSVEGSKDALTGVFKGLKVELLKKEFLTVKESRFYARGSSFRLEPLRFSGVAEGSVTLRKEQELELKAEGVLRLDRLSRHVGSLIKHNLKGVVNFIFTSRGGEFKLTFRTPEAIKVFSDFFYEPFTVGVSGEVRPDAVLMGFSMWFKKGYGTAFVLSNDYRNFSLSYELKGVPLRLVDGVRARLLSSANGRLEVKELKRLYLTGSAVVDGFVKLEKTEKKAAGEKKKLPVEFYLDYRFKTAKGIEVRLPEGRVLSSLEGRAWGRLEELNYRVKAFLRSGKLRYFGREFYLKSSVIELVKEGEHEEMRLDLTLNADLEGYKLFLKIYGSADDPRVYYFSEPPLSKEEILMALIGGGTEESFLPVAEALSKEFKTVGRVKGFLERLFDVQITLGFITSPTGEVGTVARLKKKIGKYLSLVYQTSSIKERRSNYYGGEAVPPADLELVFQFNVYSDQSREYKFRYTREFDF